MSNYARELPMDKQSNAYVTTIPAFTSNQSWSSVFTVSSMVGLSDKTTVIQLTAVGQNALFKWVNPADLTAASSVTGQIFDGVVPVGIPQTFVVPQSVMAVGYSSSMMGANGANGLYKGIAIKQTAIGGSVFGAEF